jgi:hypothetical protein
MARTFAEMQALHAAADRAAPRSFAEMQAAQQQAEPQPERFSAAESATRGFARGATFDFGDEIAGVGGALYALAKGDPDKFGKLYQEFRDIARSENDAAMAEDPKTTIGGMIGGGVATAPMTGAVAAKALQLGAKAPVVARGLEAASRAASESPRIAGALSAISKGVAGGAATGVGGSEADTASGMATDAAIGGAIGAGGAAVLGGVARAAGGLYNRGKDVAVNAIRKAIESGDDAAGIASGLGHLIGNGTVNLETTGGQVLTTAARPDVADAILGRPPRGQTGKAGEAIREGLRLEDEIGAPLSAPQLSRSKAALAEQDAISRAGDPAVVDRMAAFRDRQVEAITRKLDEWVGTAGSARAGDLGTVADEGANAYKQWVKAKWRGIQASSSRDFAAAEAAAGGAKVSAAPVVAAIDKMIAQHSSPTAPATSRKVLAELVAIRGKIVKPAEQVVDEAGNVTKIPEQAASLSIRELQNSLSEWGQLARGTGNVIENLGDKAKEIRIAANIFGAHMRALDEAATRGSLPPEAAKALAVARKNYMLAMKEFHANDSKILAKLLKADETLDGQKVLEGLANAGQYSEANVRRAMDVMRKTNPEFADRAASAALSRMFEKMSSDGVVSPQKLATAMGKAANVRHLKALLAGSKDADRIVDGLVAASKYAARISDRGASAGASPTTPMLATLVRKGMMSVGVPPSLVNGTVAFVGGKPSPAQLANLMLDQAARKTVFGAEKSGGPRTAQALEQAIYRTVAAIQSANSNASEDTE